jgi:chromosome segregation ATPase
MAQNAAGIYSCTDSRGRTLTSDRPIAECIDREQKVLNPSGTVRNRVGPTLTAQERAAQEEKDKAAALERARQAEEKRRERALLARYPNKAAHDKERAEALTQVDEVIKAANKRIVELAQQRKTIEAEYEFYKADMSKAPASLKRQVDENEHSLAVQKRFISDQEVEKKRVNARFDEELERLKRLWAILGAPARPASS